MKKLKKMYTTPVRTAFYTVLYGLIVHMFSLVNTLHNYDDISVQPQGVGTSLTSGRWFLFVLEYLGKKTTGNFNLPWFNGLILILLIGLSVYFLVSIFKIKNKYLAIIMGAGLVSFPSVTSIMFFKFTAPQYGIAILFSILSVWIVEKYKYGFLLSICLIAMSLGIYQAYFPVTVTVFLILVIKKALEKDCNIINVIKKGFLYVATMGAGMIGYFLMLKVILKLENVQLSSYQGIDSATSKSLTEMIKLLIDGIKSFMLLPINDYCNLATGSILKKAYLAVGLVSIFLIVLLIIKYKKNIINTVIVVLLCVLIPVAVNLIVLMGAETVYTLMVLSFAFLLCVPVILLDLYLDRVKANNILEKIAYYGTIISVCIIVFFNSYFANVNYSLMYYANRQTENFFASVTTQIHTVEGYDLNKKLAFIGKVDNTYFNVNKWGVQHKYGGNAEAVSLINSYSAGAWIRNYTGHRYDMASAEEISDLKDLPEVQTMTSWPNYGSVKVINDYVVVKLGE